VVIEDGAIVDVPDRYPGTADAEHRPGQLFSADDTTDPGRPGRHET
jgi:hypothetical protein